MSNIIDLTGKKFGRLTVLCRSEDRSDRVSWLCKCNCGNTKEIIGYSLKSGNTISCGCFRKAMTRANGSMNRKPEYLKRMRRIYAAMKSRCYNSKDNAYANYGGRGIRICEQWLGEHGESVFIVWAIESGYLEELTIDRKDNGKGYSPDNCRWSTMKEQQNNRRNNRIVIYKGDKFTLSRLSDFLNIPSATLAWRIDNNWDSNSLGMPPNLNNKNIRQGFYE